MTDNYKKIESKNLFKADEYDDLNKFRFNIDNVYGSICRFDMYPHKCIYVIPYSIYRKVYDMAFDNKTDDIIHIIESLAGMEYSSIEINKLLGYICIHFPKVYKEIDDYFESKIDYYL